MECCTDWPPKKGHEDKKISFIIVLFFHAVEFCIIVVDEDAFAMFTKMKRLDGAQKLALYPKEYLTADIAHPCPGHTFWPKIPDIFLHK